MKKLYVTFGLLAILLSDVMCAVVAYNYCKLTFGARYAGYSAPASTAFLLAIPYLAGIVICIILAFAFHRKQSNQTQQK